MKRLLVSLVIAGGCAGGSARAASPAPPVPDKRITVALVLTAQFYDTMKPSRGRLRCVIHNRTSEPIDVPTGYDASTVLLHSGLMSLRLARRDAGAPNKADAAIRLVRVPPGQDATVFDYALDDILLKQAAKGDQWYWDWPRRSAPPRSPFQARQGIVSQVMFQASLVLGDERLLSQFVVLHVKPTPSPPLSNPL